MSTNYARVVPLIMLAITTASQVGAHDAVGVPLAAKRPLQMQGVPPGAVKLLDCIGVTAPQTAIRVFIPRGFLTSTDDRLVRVSTNETANRGKDDFEVYDTTPFDPVTDKSNSGDFNVNPFHIDLSTPKLKAVADAYVKVRVILDDRHFTFAEAFDGVLTDDATARAKRVCQIRNDPQEPQVGKSVKSAGGGKRSLLTFYVQKNGGAWDSYVNFVIVARQKKDATDPVTGGGFATPILIDPRIKNDG